MKLNFNFGQIHFFLLVVELLGDHYSSPITRRAPGDRKPIWRDIEPITIAHSSLLTELDYQSMIPTRFGTNIMDVKIWAKELILKKL